MKKIITSIGMIVFVGAIVAGGTGAFFSDTETSTGNVFTAGAIDLKVDSVSHINGLVCFDGTWHPEAQVVWNATTEQNELALVNDVPAAVIAYNLANPANVPKAGAVCKGTWALTDLGATHTFFDYGDLKPGDNGENTISLHIENNDAYMCAYISNVQSDDNTQTEPESEPGVDVDGLASGELDEELNFLIWEDDGDNVLETPELAKILVNNENGVDVAGGYPLYTPATGGVIPALSTKYLGVYWCYGDIVQAGTTLTCNGAPVSNVSQTDSMKADLSFYVEQARNNSQFVCPTLDIPGTNPNLVEISSNDLAQTINPTKWFFYNDTNDTVMTTNQFTGTGGANDIVAFSGSNGAAYMKLDTNATPRYNIATYQFSATSLASISSLKYRIYDESEASGETAYLHFNIDFIGNDSWQKRLVQVPTGVVGDTWTEVDALAGSWTLSGGNWPIGTTEPGTTLGSTPKTWANILTEYPTAKLRTTDSFFGIRVGHPGPVGEEGYVDWVEFDGVKYDFTN